MEREYSYEEKADSLTEVRYVYMETCQDCGQQVPEGTLQLMEEYSSYFCAECLAKAELVLAAEGCEELQESVLAASSVAEMRELFRLHREKLYPPKKPMGSAAADVEIQREVA